MELEETRAGLANRALTRPHNAVEAVAIGDPPAAVPDPTNANLCSIM